MRPRGRDYIHQPHAVRPHKDRAYFSVLIGSSQERGMHGMRGVV